ncbi:MAG: hypothetical protein DI534_13575 [Leifsonia xyli]|nr:MAG: hypothetical protein DI534_13575 [Leifsonia xyli]
MQTSLSTPFLAVLGLAFAMVAVLAFRAMPRAGFVAWTAVLFFVPVWIGVQIGFFWAGITLVTLVAIVANLHQFRWMPADTLVVLFVAVSCGAFALGRAGLSATVILLLEWLVPYIWGRLVLTRLPAGFLASTLGAAAVVAAVLALLEFATGTNVFVALPALGPSYEVWGTLQYRGGLLRAEGAFGHSIALGASLALSTAFVLATRWRTLAKVVALAVIAAAIVVTFSRIALICLVITVGLSLVFQRSLSRSGRLAVIATSGIAAFIAVPLLSDVFLDAGSEASGSALYRADLFALVGQLNWLGAAIDWNQLADGVYLANYANSVDNALLVIALRFGIIPTLLLITVLLLAVVSLFLPGRANTATIAVVAQIPALFSVALITQYGMFLWFVGGLAVALASRRRDGDSGIASALGNRELLARR